MLRFFHTADWHLGQFFHQYSRYHEHQAFLTWLLQQLEQHQPDALLIAGDVFDVVNPSAQAQKQLYQFLSDAQQRVPHLHILMIAGNHDSGYRLEQVSPLLAKYQAKSIGVMEWQEIKHEQNDEKYYQPDIDKLIQPIYARQSDEIIAWCICVPFLRSAEITGRWTNQTDVLSATRILYQQLLHAVEQKKQPEQAIILMTHAHLQGGEESILSERNIIIGHQDALPVDIFSAELDYVALGHLHKAQAIQYPHIRYSGSPIPLSFSEVNYKHQVMMVDIDTQHQKVYTPLYIPRSVELVAVRCHLNELLTQLNDLPAYQDIAMEHAPFLNIEYESHTPAPPDLRHQIEKILADKHYRLVRLARHYPQTTTTEQNNPVSLNQQLAPRPLALFEQEWQRVGNDIEQIDEQLRQDFQLLFDEAQDLLQGMTGYQTD